jgi:uncharacterized membrane protein
MSKTLRHRRFQKMIRFIRTTIVGGILFLLPFGVLIFVLGQVLPVAQKIVQPLAALIPFSSFIGLNIPVLLTGLLMLLICFVTGLFARTTLATRLVGELEKSVLSNIPGYDLLKQMSADIAGSADSSQQQVVIVRLDDAIQVGLKIEDIDDGKRLAVFIPDAPIPHTGGIVIVDADRVTETNMSVKALLACLVRRGQGLNTLLRP